MLTNLGGTSISASRRMFWDMSWLLVKDLETEMKWHVETSKRCSYLSISLVSGFLHRNPIVKFFVSNLCCRYEIKSYLRHIFAHLLFYLAHGQKASPIQFRSDCCVR